MARMIDIASLGAPESGARFVTLELYLKRQGACLVGQKPTDFSLVSTPTKIIRFAVLAHLPAAASEVAIKD